METTEIKYTKTELLHLINKMKEKHDNKKIEIKNQIDVLDPMEIAINKEIDKNNKLLEELTLIENEYVDLMKEYTTTK